MICVILKKRNSEILKISQPVGLEWGHLGNQSIVTPHLGHVSFIGAPGGLWAFGSFIDSIIFPLNSIPGPSVSIKWSFPQLISKWSLFSYEMEITINMTMALMMTKVFTEGLSFCIVGSQLTSKWKNMKNMISCNTMMITMKTMMMTTDGEYLFTDGLAYCRVTWGWGLCIL